MKATDPLPIPRRTIAKRALLVVVLSAGLAIIFGGCDQLPGFGSVPLELRAPARATFGESEEALQVLVTVVNHGSAPLSSQNDQFLSYHLQDRSGTLLRWDNPRSPLPHIAPGTQAEVMLRIDHPGEPGEYTAMVDVVHEGVAWFSDRGGRTATVRLTVPESARPTYLATVEAPGDTVHIMEGGFIDLTLTVTNRGRQVWDSFAEAPVHLSYHILDPRGSVVVHDNPRTAFETPVLPDGRREVRVRIPATRFPRPGKYVLEFDLVHEGITWFASQGSATTRTPAMVASPEPDRVSDEQLRRPARSGIEAARPEFNLLWKHIGATLEFTQREITVDGRTYGGFVAGMGYPQFWTRDNATVIPGARWFSDREHLVGWVLLHLHRQQPNGALFDWVDARGTTEKNTVETDQETSLVVGLAEYVWATGDIAVLREQIDGVTVIERLERALEYVWQHKRDAETGLLIGAHTIDWGDVDIVDADQQAVRTDERTRWTVDIYDNAMYAMAADRLAALLETAMQSPRRADLWRERSASIRKRSRAVLWQEDRGYFRMHRHVTPLQHPFNEDAMFPMGGNAVAVLAGMATADMAASIIDSALRRQQEYALPTLSGVMLPPYPEGTFRHPLVSPEYSYQNGGLWDWFGARLVQAMYRHGRSAEATDKLAEMARLAASNGGIYEWQDRAGAPRGSAYYSGAAALLAQALVEGYFGVVLSRDSLQVAPRLGIHPGRVALREPATERRVAYEYRFRADAQVAELHLWTNVTVPVRLSLLVPPHAAAVESAQLDGLPVQTMLRTVGKDRYADVEGVRFGGQLVLEVHYR
jgi:hypothetical protein